LDTEITFRNVSPELRTGEISPIASTAASGSRHISPLRAVRGQNSFRIEAEVTENGGRIAELFLSGWFLSKIICRDTLNAILRSITDIH
jgi:hypothetical protein